MKFVNQDKIMNRILVCNNIKYHPSSAKDTFTPIPNEAEKFRPPFEAIIHE
jgi:hypothetical protein